MVEVWPQLSQFRGELVLVQRRKEVGDDGDVCNDDHGGGTLLMGLLLVG